MNDLRANRQLDRAGSPRVQRRAAGLVAEYIRELSSVRGDRLRRAPRPAPMAIPQPREGA